jgi:DNA-binding transcriptional ArsR family regulator
VIADDLLEFIRGSIRSVWNVELILLMWRQSRRTWAPDELVRELRASEFVVSEGLGALQAAGLVTAEADGRYRYAPASPEFDRLVQQLDQVYRERPTAVTRAIFSSPTDKLQTFADAFRLKKD